MSMNPASYFRSFDELQHHIEVEGIDVQTLEFDEDIELASDGIDHRLDQLSADAREAVMIFDNDVDETAYIASRVVNNFRNPPPWAIEIHNAQRNGWKVPVAA